ncbi:cellobiohydrolase I-II [Ceratobasidium sp. AG-I]|nr:cellobiohydrolase I-II [Ceratobasidium sp. AG-I]
MKTFYHILLIILGVARAQQVGLYVSETHPSLTWQKCTKSGGCVTQSSGKIVLDADKRWLHSTGGYSNCYTGNRWEPTLCPDPLTCAKNCAIEGADYASTYGVTTSGNAVTLKFVTPENISSRVYLLANDSAYQTFNVNNQEFTFDVDVSNLPCGLNGALSLAEMDADGGMAKYPTNKAGAKYGTGYCNSKCSKSVKFINGEANILNWVPSNTDPNSGTGSYGSCCNDMNIWDANSMSTVYTAHPCTTVGQTRCSGSNCTSGYCDSAGCDFNPYRLGNKTFYGRGLTIDTTRKITVVTQFIVGDSTSKGALSEISRLYIQNGKVIQNAKTSVPGMAVFDSITEPFCAAEKTAFGEPNDFAAKGGFKNLGSAFNRGMVLSMSIWDDYETRMLWLDSTYPLDADPSKPGVARGSCSTGTGVPADIEVIGGISSVTFSNIRFGDINSTYGAVAVGGTTSD